MTLEKAAIVSHALKERNDVYDMVRKIERADLYYFKITCMATPHDNKAQIDIPMSCNERILNELKEILKMQEAQIKNF